MLKTKRFLIPLLCALMLASACKTGSVVTNPTPTDARVVIITQVDRAAKGLDALMDIKRALYKDGLITAEQSNAITKAVQKASPLVRHIKDKTETYATIDLTAKAGILAAVQEAIAVANDLNNQSLLGLNPAARDKVMVVFAATTGALTFLKTFLGGN